ncbi:MAG: hypothetical protein OES24_00980 [Acidimicrobiia bacterium]|nr:hypothetical protein [Acidimicrobiia bacterium]
MTPTIAVAGLGTTGGHVVRHLVDELSPPLALRLHDTDADAEDRARKQVGDRAPVEVGRIPGGETADVTILATPCGDHAAVASRLLGAGGHVVSISDSPDDIDALLELDDLAREAGRSLVVGAGMAPGLGCLLARHAGNQLDTVDSINIAKAGTAGPACARQHHRALKLPGRDWVGSGWELRAGGSGRDLAWFPEPIGARDCYRGALGSPILLHRRYPEAKRLSARMSATRRDRLTARLPMLRKPHQDGGPGAVRAEVRGWRNGRVETIVYAVTAFPSVVAAAVAVVVALRLAAGHGPVGASGLSEWDDANLILTELHRRGVPISTFSGIVGDPS